MENVFQGNHDSNLWEKNKWEKYVKGETSVLSGTGSIILKTAAYLKKSTITVPFKLQEQSITIGGGANSIFHNIKDCVRYGSRTMGKCHGSSDHCQGPAKIKDAQYYMGHASDIHKSWRFTSSLPQFSRYGKKDDDGSIKYSTANFTSAKNGSNKDVNIDDSTFTPNSLNLLPLMKI